MIYDLQKNSYIKSVIGKGLSSNKKESQGLGLNLVQTSRILPGKAKNGGKKEKNEKLDVSEHLKIDLINE